MVDGHRHSSLYDSGNSNQLELETDDVQETWPVRVRHHMRTLEGSSRAAREVLLPVTAVTSESSGTLSSGKRTNRMTGRWQELLQKGWERSMAVPLSCIQNRTDHQEAQLGVVFGCMCVDVLEQMGGDYGKRIFCNIDKTEVVKGCYTDARWNLKSLALRRSQGSRYLFWHQICEVRREATEGS